MTSFRLVGSNAPATFPMAKDISITMKEIVKALVESPPPPAPQPGGTHAQLWQKIEALPITAEDKISLGVYLLFPEKQVMRDFLASSSDKTLDLCLQVLM